MDEEEQRHSTNPLSRGTAAAGAQGGTDEKGRNGLIASHGGWGPHPLLIPVMSSNSVVETDEEDDPAEIEMYDIEADTFAAQQASSRRLRRRRAQRRDEEVNSMIEQSGTGFYGLATCILLRGVDVPLWKSTSWVIGASGFLLFQVVALISLILSIAVPLCEQQADCDQDNGWVCVVFPGSSRGFCVDCRIPVCANDDDPNLSFSNVTAVHTNGMLASNFCMQNMYPYLYENEGCYLLKSAKNKMTTASWLVVVMVCMGLGLSLMMEKRQALLHNRMLRIGLSLSSCRCCHLCCIDTHDHTNHNKAVDEKDEDDAVVGVDSGDDTTIGKDQGCTFCHISTTSRDGRLRETTRTASSEPFRTTSTTSRYAGNAVFNPNDPKATRAIRQRTHHRRLVNVMLSLNYARQVFLLPLTSTTVACLIGFQGTDPLNILLNALATVFILELDDTAGAVLFSPHYRSRASMKFIKVLRLLEDTRLTMKFDYFSGVLVLCTGVATVIDNLIEGAELNSCYRVFNRFYFFDMARFCFADLIEDAARRWVFYRRHGAQEAAEGTTRAHEFALKACSVLVGVLRRFISMAIVLCLGAIAVATVMLMHTAKASDELFFAHQITNALLYDKAFDGSFQCPSR